MNTINVDLSTGEALNLPIGRQGENNVTQVVFNFSALNTEFGSGTLSLSVKRPKEYVPYAQTMTISGTNATWLVNETDTGNFGCGEIQLTYTVSGKVAKTVIYKYTVLRSIGADGEYPIPGQTWQEEIEDDIADIKADLAEIEGGGVPTNVRQALKTLLESAAYADTGLTDEMAVISSWASQVTAITLNQSSISISGATTSQLTATTTPSGGSVTWSSSDTSVATVSSSGLVTGVSNGTATITATSGDVSATCSVTVSGIATLSSISASYTQTGTLYDTDDLADILTAGTLVVTATYSDSSTSTVASTDYTLSGTLTEGTSTITVTYSGKTTTFIVTVSLDTTAKIAVEGYALDWKQAQGGYYQREQANSGITVKYQLDAPTTSLYPAGIIPYADSVFIANGNIMVAYDDNGTEVIYVAEKTTSTDNRWAQKSSSPTEFKNEWTVEEYTQLAFSVDTRYLDDAYMYHYPTGQVFFAGRNTPYFGMKNISEASN